MPSCPFCLWSENTSSCASVTMPLQNTSNWMTTKSTPLLTSWNTFHHHREHHSSPVPDVSGSTKRSICTVNVVVLNCRLQNVRSASIRCTDHVSQKVWCVKILFFLYQEARKSPPVTMLYYSLLICNIMVDAVGFNDEVCNVIITMQRGPASKSYSSL